MAAPSSVTDSLQGRLAHTSDPRERVQLLLNLKDLNEDTHLNLPYSIQLFREAAAIRDTYAMSVSIIPILSRYSIYTEKKDTLRYYLQALLRPDSRHTRRGCRRLCRNVHRVLPPGAPVRPCGEPQAGTRGLRLEQYPARRTREHLPAHQTPVSARLCQHHALLLRGRKPAGLHPADRHVARSLRTDEANAEPQYPQVLRQHHLLRAERRLQPELPPR